MYRRSNDTSLKVRNDLLVSLFLVLSTVAVYWQVGRHQFINYDDPLYVTQNQPVKSGLDFSSIRWAFVTPIDGNYHPVTTLSHMLDCQLYGMNSGQHHITSLLIHIINVLLLFLILRKLTKNLWKSAFVAAMFAIHPLHVESVAWVSERKDVLSTCFWLLTMWAYSWYVVRPSVFRQLSVLVFFILGLMSKPMLVTLPFVLLVMDYWPLCRFRFGQSDCVVNDTAKNLKARVLFLEKIPLFVISALFCVITYLVEKSGGSVASLDIYPLGVRISNALVSYVVYIEKMIWPYDLTIFYPHPDTILILPTAMASMFLATVTFLAIKARTKFPYVIVGWLWYLGVLVPVIGIVQIGSQAMADRYTYVPLIGLFLIVSWGVPDMLRGWRYKKTVIIVSATAVISAMIICTSAQLRYWKSTFSVFSRNISVTGENFLAYNNLGAYFTQKGNMNTAMRHYLKSLQIDPCSPLAHFNIANVYTRQGSLEKAVHHYQEALLIAPDYVRAYNNLGNVFARQDNFKEAIAQYNEALRIDPDNVMACSNLGAALEQLGEFKKAKECYLKALAIDPSFLSAKRNLERLDSVSEKSGAKSYYLVEE